MFDLYKDSFKLALLFTAWPLKVFELKQLTIILMHVSTISFYYGLCAQDIDTVLFIFWSIEYLDKMTKRRAMAIIIGIKIISIVTVSVPSMLIQWSCTVDINCALYSLEAIFFQTIPYMIYFLISLLVTYLLYFM